MTTQLFIDIETIPSQNPDVLSDFRAAVQAPGQYKKPESIAAWMAENREQEAESAWLKTSFDGGLGQCVCIGYAFDDDAAQCITVGDLSRENEREALHQFFSIVRLAGRCQVIGHNVIGFDLPFLWKRACVLNVRPPAALPRNPKPWDECVQDTMLMWDSQQRAGGSLDRLCRLMGIPGKGDISGADVWPMVRDGRLVEVAAYCCADVDRTRSLYRRMTFSDCAELRAAA